MPGLSFPDVNVWMAVLLTEHVHHTQAKLWWRTDDFDSICFTRITQMSVLRLLTTATIMNGKPLTMRAAWRTYDRLFADDRVSYLPEPPNVEASFRRYASENVSSPKVWADSWLLAMGENHDGKIVTFDARLADRGNSIAEGRCILLA